MKTFTLEEASTLLPVLESLLKRAVVAKEKVELRQLKLFCPRHRQLVALRGRVSALGQSPGELIARGAYPKTPYSR